MNNYNQNVRIDSNKIKKCSCQDKFGPKPFNLTNNQTNQSQKQQNFYTKKGE